VRRNDVDMCGKIGSIEKQQGTRKQQGARKQEQ